MAGREQAEAAAATWIGKRDSDAWTEADEHEFNAWLVQSVEHRVAYYRLHAAWQETGRLKVLGANVLSEPVRVSAPRTMPRLAWMVAACVLLSIGAASFALRAVYFLDDRYATTIGDLEAVPLTDGSTITLNTDSEIHVDVGASERRVELDRGEAFFEVAKDPERPFVVVAGSSRVIAVGTKFAVRRVEDDLRVIVTEGKVRVERANAAQPRTELTVGDLALARRDALLVHTANPEQLEQLLSWRSGFLVFRNTPLADVIAEFNRYNARQITLENANIGKLEIGGVFRSTDLDVFVRLLEQGFPVRATQHEGRIVLSAAPMPP